ncbi:MAG: acyl carrier protein [Acidimicrobiales bacterium]
MSDRTLVIRNVLAEHGRLTSSVDELADGDSLFNVGLTSHASVNVMLALEDEFDLEFPERFLKRSTFESIANLRLALDELLGADV